MDEPELIGANQLAKASTLALISMSVIISTVVIQGALTPLADRGSFTTPLLTINSGIFQAVGVISFGTYDTLAPRERGPVSPKPY